MAGWKDPIKEPLRQGYIIWAQDPYLPGQPTTPPGADWPVEDTHPVIEGDPDWVVPVEE